MEEPGLWDRKLCFALAWVTDGVLTEQLWAADNN